MLYFDAFISKGTAVQETILISKVNERGRNQMPYGTLFPHDEFVLACQRGIKRYSELVAYRKHKWQRVFYSLFPSLLPPIDRSRIGSKRKDENITINDFIMQERFTLQNSGIKPIVITSVHVGPQNQIHNSSNLPVQCHYQGFSVSNCTGFTIPTDKPAMIYVHYAPDFHNNYNGVKITFVTNVTTRFDWNVSSFLPTTFLKKDGYSYIKSNVLRNAAEKHLLENMIFLDEKHVLTTSEDKKSKNCGDKNCLDVGFSEACKLMLPEPGNEEYIHFWTAIGFVLIVMLTVIIALGEGHNWFIESCKWVSQDNESWTPEEQELYFWNLWRLGIWQFLPVKNKQKVNENVLKNDEIMKKSVEKEDVEEKITLTNKNISKLQKPNKKSRVRNSSASSATGTDAKQSKKNKTPPRKPKSNQKTKNTEARQYNTILRPKLPVYETSSDDDTSGWEQSTNSRKLRMQKRKEMQFLQEKENIKDDKVDNKDEEIEEIADVIQQEQPLGTISSSYIKLVDATANHQVKPVFKQTPSPEPILSKPPPGLFPRVMNSQTPDLMKVVNHENSVSSNNSIFRKTQRHDSGKKKIEASKVQSSNKDATPAQAAIMNNFIPSQASNTNFSVKKCL